VRDTSRRQLPEQAKVFWFFFSKKNTLSFLGLIHVRAHDLAVPDSGTDDLAGPAGEMPIDSPDGHGLRAATSIEGLVCDQQWPQAAPMPPAPPLSSR
jgi:hypothetical protein